STAGVSRYYKHPSAHLILNGVAAHTSARQLKSSPTRHFRMAYRCPIETTEAPRALGRRQFVATLLAAFGIFLASERASAQFGSAPASDLSEAVQVDEASSAARTMLERAKAHLAEKQWDEAIETLGQVTEREGGKLVRSD